MPGTPAPVGANGPLNPWWNAFVQRLASHGRAIAAVQAARVQGNVVDQFGNTTEVYGTNLNQVVTIGASFGRPGVQVGTHFPPSLGVAQSGRAVQQNLAIGTITTTEGSTSATLTSTSSGTFTSGQVIGAADVSDPSSGIATPAIVPGTTFTISGSTITLSQPAAESGTGLHCAACNFSLVT